MHSLKRYKWFILMVCLTAPLLLMGDSCSDQPATADQQREQALKQRTQAFARAEAQIPTPTPQNFPLRRALAEFTDRQDLVNHPWYIYLLGQNGNTIGYYVAKTVPINACDFLSSTQQVHNSDQGSTVLTAPSLDGIYYGGSGAASGCDSWFFFDYSSNALIQIRGVNWYSADKPLAIDAQPIKVK